MLGSGDKGRVTRKGTSSLNIGCSLAGETMGTALRGGCVLLCLSAFCLLLFLGEQNISIFEKVVYEMTVLEAC